MMITTSKLSSPIHHGTKRIIFLSMLMAVMIFGVCFVLAINEDDDDQNSLYQDDSSSIEERINQDNIIEITTLKEYEQVYSKYGSDYHIITLVSFSEEQERMHQCLHCKLYRDLLKKYVNSFSDELKGVLIEFTPQSQELIIQKLRLTHLPSVTIKSRNVNQLYDCNLKESQLWECVKDAFKNSDQNLYQQLENFIDMEDIKELYLKYKSEFEKQSGNGGGNQQNQQAESNFDFSSFKSITKIVLIAFCIVGFVVGISTLQNLLNGSRYMIFILCILTYILCMSGTVFNMIQNPPPYQYNPRENSISFFYPSMRMSFALEGYIATFVIVISSFYFIAIPYYGFYDKNTDNTSIIESDSNTTTTTSNKNDKKKKKNAGSNNNTATTEKEEEIVESEKTARESSHYKSVLQRLFFIWGFFVTFTAAMVFFMIKTSFYLSDTPYQGWVQLLLAIFNH